MSPFAQAIKAVVLNSGVPADRYTGPQSQLFKKRSYEDKPAVTIDVPAKLQRTGDLTRTGRYKINKRLSTRSCFGIRQTG
jgi:hypothetical protein